MISTNSSSAAQGSAGSSSAAGPEGLQDYATGSRGCRWLRNPSWPGTTVIDGEQLQSEIVRIKDGL
ncbi:hypothetical protein AB0D97_26555, partial [Streptomyces roseus]